MSAKEFIHPIRVYIEDTDAGGIVYYVNYLKYIERSRTEFLRSLGYGKAAILEDGLLLVVRSTEIDYLSPARLDDEVLATTRLQKLAKTYVIFEQEVRRGESVLCRAIVKVACVSEKNGAMRPSAIPENMRSSLISCL
jgi:4-hydroxybenzoyl-CoA thioesterase/acyl-CoA thioester hydrolase